MDSIADSLQVGCRQTIMERRYYLKEVTVNSFKSFGGVTSIRFNDKLNCIVGKNGCGKSALIDAICCSLGVDVRRLRCDKYAELITHLETKTASQCTVQLLFQDMRDPKTLLLAFTAEDNGTTTYDWEAYKHADSATTGNSSHANGFGRRSLSSWVFASILILSL